MRKLLRFTLKKNIGLAAAAITGAGYNASDGDFGSPKFWAAIMIAVLQGAFQIAAHKKNQDGGDAREPYVPPVKKKSKPPPPLSRMSIITQIQATAGQHGVDPALALAVAQAESSFNPAAQGSAGEIGLFQLMPGTARDMGVSDPWNIGSNIEGGIRYLRYLLDRYGGDETRALAAYNGGLGNMDRGTTSQQAWDYAGNVLNIRKDWTPTGSAWPGAREAGTVTAGPAFVILAAALGLAGLVSLILD